MNIKQEIDILIGMIQRPASIKTCNFEMYKDEVTGYREIIYNQAMKIRKTLTKDYGFNNLFPNRKKVTALSLKAQGYKKMSEWTKIESAVFKFEKIGDSIEGFLKSVEPSIQHENKIYKIEDSKKKLYTVFGTVILDDLMQTVSIGSLVRIIYTGAKESKKGQNPTKLFEVFCK